MLANVGGDHIDIKTIVGAGGDSELYQPTAADVATVAAARAVFLNDLNDEFEPWLEPLLKQAAFKGVKVVVSRHVRTLTAEEEHPVSGRQLPSAIDQHAWLDPRNGVIYVRNIADALARLDPPNASDYRTRAAAYTKEIQALDDWARKEIGGVSADQRRVLTSHDSLQYLANAYGITLLTVNGWTNNSEPSAAELAKLAQRIRAAHVKALFLDSITDPRAMQRIAGETGAAIGGTLYGDSLSPAGGERGQLPRDAAPRRGHAEGRHAEQLSDAACRGLEAAAGGRCRGGRVVGRRALGRAIDAIDRAGAAIGAGGRHGAPPRQAVEAGALRAVVRSGLAAPGGGRFDRFDVAAQPVVAPVNARGQVAFYATVLRAPGREGIFLAEAGRITKVAAFGDAGAGRRDARRLRGRSAAGAERGGACGVRCPDRRRAVDRRGLPRRR